VCRGSQVAALRAGRVTLFDSSGEMPAENFIAALVRARSDLSA
jgi:hypothetical protein